MIIDGHIAYCRECGNELEQGDKIDPYFPYFSDKNLCCKCKELNIKGTKKDKWNGKIGKVSHTNNKLEMELAKKLVEAFRQETENLKEIRNSGNSYGIGYWEGLRRKTMELIATSSISDEAWQYSGLTYEEKEICELEIIG